MHCAVVLGSWRRSPEHTASASGGGPQRQPRAFSFSALAGFAPAFQGLVRGFGRQGAGRTSAPVFPQEQVRCGLHPGCYKSSIPFWPRTPLREGQGPSEHLIFPLMPVTKNNTHLPHSARKSRDFSPAATPAPSSPSNPAQSTPSPSVLYPQPHFG